MTRRRENRTTNAVADQMARELLGGERHNGWPEPLKEPAGTHPRPTRR